MREDEGGVTLEEVEWGVVEDVLVMLVEDSLGVVEDGDSASLGEDNGGFEGGWFLRFWFGF